MTHHPLFEKQMKELLTSEYEDFLYALHLSPPVSIRLNPSKPENQLQLGDPVPWCKFGYYLNERPVFTLDPFFHAGHYYVQEASSMFLHYIYSSLKLKKNPRILDLCSAPGGKATLLLTILKDEGLLHCHEFDYYRANTLKNNIERWGFSNSIVTTGPIHQFSNHEILYDLILVDAPCSGEGMFRKSKDAVKQWSPGKIESCVRTQSRILQIADTLCAEGGYIIYSTCTWNSLENEQQVTPYFDTQRYIPISISNEFNISLYNDKTCTYRFFPHKIKGEGFTITVMQKVTNEPHPKSEQHHIALSKLKNNFNLEDWLQTPTAYTGIEFRDNIFAIPNQYSYEMEKIFIQIKTLHLGIDIGKNRNDHFFPSQGLSQSLNANQNLPEYSLDLQQALNYLRANTPDLPGVPGSKWLIASYQTAQLGWLKSGEKGLKNCFPKHLRIVSY